MYNDYSRCDICKLLVKHLKILFTELGNSELDSDKKATLMEMKCYYWLVKVYLNEFLQDCECAYSRGLKNILKSLKDIFEKEDILLDEKKKKCDVCKILPCEIFPLLDKTCCLNNSTDLDSIIEELQYHFILVTLYETLIGKCTECDEFVEYTACSEFLCDFIQSQNLEKLQQDVYYWKVAGNNDAILSCADALNIDEIVQSTYVDLDNHITVYLDFNVYQRYEDDNKVRKFLKALIQQEDVDIIYSDTHLEEILRMGQKSYEIKRLNSIQELTKSKIAIVGNNQKIAVRILDIEKRFHQVAKYVKINAAAEERECILAEAGEHLCLNEFNEQQNKAIGSSSLREIISNVNKNGKKKKDYLPDEKDLNKILRYIGIEKRSIREYMDALKHHDKEFYEIRTMIVSIAELLNILGLHGDKIQKKTNPRAVYPIYHKDSFRSIRSGYYDNDHLTFATKCTYFVTTDDTLYKKGKEIYEFLGVDTVTVLLKDFMELSSIKK